MENNLSMFVVAQVVQKLVVQLPILNSLLDKLIERYSVHIVDAC